MAFVSIIYRRTFLKLRYKLRFHSLSEWEMHLDMFPSCSSHIFPHGGSISKTSSPIAGRHKALQTTPFLCCKQEWTMGEQRPEVFWPVMCFPFKNILLVRPRRAKDVQWFLGVIGSVSQMRRPEVGHLAPKALKTRRHFKDLRALKNQNPWVH